jgi:hypothetical protein
MYPVTARGTENVLHYALEFSFKDSATATRENYWGSYSIPGQRGGHGRPCIWFDIGNARWLDLDKLSRCLVMGSGINNVFTTSVG